MASRIGMSYRNEAAQGRIDASLPVVAARLGLDIPPMPVNRRDKTLQETLRLEWMADVLEAIDANLDGATVPGPHEVESGAFLDRELLKEHKLDDLKAMAVDAGADAEAVGRMRSKDDVIEAIANQVDADATINGDDEERGEA